MWIWNRFQCWKYEERRILARLIVLRAADSWLDQNSIIVTNLLEQAAVGVFSPRAAVNWLQSQEEQSRARLLQIHPLGSAKGRKLAPRGKSGFCIYHLWGAQEPQADYNPAKLPFSQQSMVHGKNCDTKFGFQDSSFQKDKIYLK